MEKIEGSIVTHETFHSQLVYYKLVTTGFQVCLILRPPFWNPS